MVTAATLSLGFTTGSSVIPSGVSAETVSQTISTNETTTPTDKESFVKLKKETEAASQLVKEAEGKVLDDTNRIKLQQLVDSTNHDFGTDGRLTLRDFITNETFNTRYDEITGLEQKVKEDRTAWDKEQERIAAEKAAAEAQAKKSTQSSTGSTSSKVDAGTPSKQQTKKSAQSAPSNNTSQAPSSSSAPTASAPARANYTLNVSGYCNQNQSCVQSSVDNNSLAYIVYPGGGLTEIAGHNYGAGGVIARFQPGTTVQVNGVGAGLYRVTSLVYVSKGANTGDVPGGFAFQTCVGNRMVLAYATRIG